MKKKGIYKVRLTRDEIILIESVLRTCDENAVAAGFNSSISKLTSIKPIKALTKPQMTDLLNYLVDVETSKEA